MLSKSAQIRWKLTRVILCLKSDCCNCKKNYWHFWLILKTSSLLKKCFMGQIFTKVKIVEKARCCWLLWNRISNKSDGRCCLHSFPNCNSLKMTNIFYFYSLPPKKWNITKLPERDLAHNTGYPETKFLKNLLENVPDTFPISNSVVTRIGRQASRKSRCICPCGQRKIYLTKNTNFS